ncbi:hypothetical protein K493DRAFT_408460 [Basidiobolus meristosporus CBS 931.73]|uniref:Endoplasmic reticulum junction formation protein lunapark n=1 Tax=Basidiobolus meristosporus CBS 931.73 TaxID=1314790 RepID=A0A1Y1Y5K4_9FUNG|nr:hypothetical protein K493DRAFT_408460 [Basidiobolus meristosporus CBS 931.73]|eukprot:ORX93297.1 hypothetical protein K493DRAFT_408460 [Basidiobolus meristosporus CBS 931.73]
MGAVFSVFKHREEDNYEKILADLEDKIQKVEVRLSDIKVRERKFVLLFLIYSLFAYGLYLATYFVYLRDAQDALYIWLWKLLPAFVIPFSIYYISRGVSYWYNRKRLNEENQLENLRVKQRQKVEELKKKTAYYSTKTLLDRYDTPVKAKPGAKMPGPKSNTPQNNNRPQTRGNPTAPNSAPVNPNLRPKNQPNSLNGISSASTPAPQNPYTNGIKLPGTTPYHAPRIGASNGINSHHAFNTQRNSWYDRIIDVIVGEEGPNSKYALICKNCFAHNGLALPSEINEIQYHCPKCNFLNASRHPRTRPMQTPVTNSINTASKDQKATESTLPETPARSPAELRATKELSDNEKVSSDEHVAEDQATDTTKEQEEEEEEDEPEDAEPNQNGSHKTNQSEEAAKPPQIEPKNATFRQRKQKSRKKNE